MRTVEGREDKRVGVAEASRMLGVSPRTVQNYVRRGLLDAVRDSHDRYAISRTSVEELRSKQQRQDAGVDRGRTPRRDEMLDQLRDEIAYLRSQLEREREANSENRRLLAAALERIPALEPPSEPRESPVSSDEDEDRPVGRSDESEAHTSTSQQRGFWSRFFSGE